ncbi:hypothetical protein [Streptococcus gallolyticus]|uniref:hypothetical protein n=1 Tax=Streptococcus gallolyticus TaxID=315405 RepID=UPI001F253A5E|nr:hypothetical protein [Streptococcus gallolyticus]
MNVKSYLAQTERCFLPSQSRHYSPFSTDVLVVESLDDHNQHTLLLLNTLGSCTFPFELSEYYGNSILT